MFKIINSMQTKSDSQVPKDKCVPRKSKMKSNGVENTLGSKAMSKPKVQIRIIL